MSNLEMEIASVWFDLMLTLLCSSSVELIVVVVVVVSVAVAVNEQRKAIRYMESILTAEFLGATREAAIEEFCCLKSVQIIGEESLANIEPERVVLCLPVHLKLSTTLLSAIVVHLLAIICCHSRALLPH